MFCHKLFRTALFSKPPNTYAATKYSSQRNIQITLVGATNDIGTYLALLLKQSNKINKLHLYDDDAKVKGIGIELTHIPGGPEVSVWTGDTLLNTAVEGSHVIVMVHRVPRKVGNTREQMLAVNAPAVLNLCRAVANKNPEAFLAIATNPINSMIPFASTLMHEYGCYNPFKIFGINHIDLARARMLTARALHINPVDVSVPVIGGHSDETIVPLFSNMQPATTVFDPYQANTLTRLVRIAGTEVIYQKRGQNSATFAMAMSIRDFIHLIVDALNGEEVLVNCYTANPNFGTRFFSGPTKVGPYGIIQTCNNFQYSDYEAFLLNSCIPMINRDVGLGEGYVQFIDKIGSKH